VRRAAYAVGAPTRLPTTYILPESCYETCCRADAMCAGRLSRKLMLSRLRSSVECLQPVGLIITPVGFT
jgi:hypothetical protein